MTKNQQSIHIYHCFKEVYHNQPKGKFRTNHRKELLLTRIFFSVTGSASRTWLFGFVFIQESGNTLIFVILVVQIFILKMHLHFKDERRWLSDINLLYGTKASSFMECRTSQITSSCDLESRKKEQNAFNSIFSVSL